MYRKPGETFEAHLDRTLADVRASLMFAQETYRAATEQKILSHVVSEIGRIVHGELQALGLATDREFR